MIGRVGIIAEREIRAYAGAPSFWLALAAGPLFTLVVAAAFGSAGLGKPVRPLLLEITGDPTYASVVQKALTTPATHERPLAILPTADRRPADTVLSIAGNQSVLRVTQTGTALPAAALARLQAALEAERKDRALRSAGAPAALLEAAEGRVTVRPVVADPDQRKDGRTGRFIMAMALWMNLVGSLGMLLQAVVRERSNRALESLLSLARPAEVVLGKLIGVGVLSLVVLAAWLGGGAAAAVLLHPFGGDVGGGLGAGLAAQLLLAAIVYPFAFAMFGAAIIGVGALANDGAAANSLSRPIFGVLLLVFFMVLWQWIEPGQTRDWLAFIPPFTPFALVLAGPGHTSGWVFAACLALMAAMTLAATALAAAAVAGPAFNGFTPERLWRIVENARIR